MGKKRPKPQMNAGQPVSGSAKQLISEVERLQQEGYVALPARRVFHDKIGSDSQSLWKDVFNTAYLSGSNGANTSVISPIGTEVQSDLNIGTPGKGYIQWGPGNRLPNTIAMLVSLLPYTATGVKFNTDVIAGLGPRPKYRYSYYSNGSIQTKEIDYSAAGKLLQGQLMEKRVQLANLYGECSEKGIDLRRSNDADSVTKLYQEMELQLICEIKEAQDAYSKWESTDKEVSAFVQDSNLELIYTQLANDMSHLGICFPELKLDKQGNNRNTVTWIPKVIGIDYKSGCTCRMERMDDNNRVNYIYVSNLWLDFNQSVGMDNNSIAAIPALDPQRPLSSLKEKVRNTRIRAYMGKKNRKGNDVSERPTRFILPSFYPSLGRPYYPQPMWYSIFSGDIYKYVSTIIENRAIAKENSNMAGKIIYIHTDYLNKLYMLEKAETSEQREQLRDQMWDEINAFLKDRNNNGQTILSFTFTGNDGKEHDAWRIVDVPLSSKQEAEANKTELEELSSVIFFSLEIHPDLIGAIPGRSGSSGGTYQREMYEMKKLMMAPTQRLLLKCLEVARDFNEWDSHLVWSIQQMTLTTLDRNKNGVEETKV